MNKASYVSRRLLYDICDIMTPIESELECIFSLLRNWMLIFTDRFGTRIRVPQIRERAEDMRRDLAQLYSAIFHYYRNRNSTRTLNCIFTITYYMMLRYKDNVILCSQISTYFYVITRDLESWDSFPSSYDTVV